MSDEFKPTVRIHRGKYGAAKVETNTATNTAATSSGETIFDLESGGVGPFREPEPKPTPQVQSTSRREPVQEPVREPPRQIIAPTPPPRIDPAQEKKLRQMVEKAKREVERPKKEPTTKDYSLWVGLGGVAAFWLYLNHAQSSCCSGNSHNHGDAGNAGGKGAAFDPAKHF